MAAVKETIDAVAALEKYEHGFTSDIETEFAPKGLNADIVRFISEKKGEPQWMLEWRLAAFERWQAMEEPTWASVKYDPVDYQALYYYAAPKAKAGPKPRRGRSRTAGRLCQAGHPAEGAGGAGGGRGRAALRRRRRVRQCVGGHHLQEGTGGRRRDLHAHFRGLARIS
jgi:hypothetical protein